MTHGGPHEEADHAEHHAVDPFNKRVAMSMVVIAALLASVRVLGHRTHTDTLNYQIAANVNHTKESDQWNYFQAKKNRLYLYEAEADLLDYLGRKGPVPVAVLDDLDVAEVAREKPKPDKKKKKSVLTPADEKEIAALMEKGLPKDAAQRVVTWRSQARVYHQDADDIQAKATELQDKAELYQKMSHHKHEQSFWFDLGELGIELAIVLCSVAILTKQQSFWFGGMAVGLVGLAVVGVGFFVH